MDNNLENFLVEIVNEVKLGSESECCDLQEAFFLHVMPQLFEAGSISDYEYIAYYKKNKSIMQCSGFGWSPLDGTMNLILTDFNNIDDSISTIGKTEIDAYGKQISRLIEKKDDSEFEFMEDPEHDVFLLFNALNENWDSIIKFRLLIISNRVRSSRINKLLIDNILGKESSIELCDLETLYSLSQSTTESAPFFVDFESMCNGLPALQANSSSEQQDSFLTVIPGQVLSDIYHEYGQSLLESNVRTYLGSVSKANKGMRATLVQEPDNFFVYNNGLTVTANSVETKKINNQVIICRLENMQIVNGGQTTSSIYFSPRDKGGYGELAYKNIDLKKVSVPVKLVIVGNDDKADEIKGFISKYSNTQNAVQSSDLVSNHPFHKQIEKLSRRILMPAADAGYMSKWFYERARGQYQTMLRAKSSVSAKNKFENEFPKNQKIVKTDLAKYENLWRMNPHEVKKGAQINLDKFIGPKIASEYDKNADSFRESFYYDLIAKAILYKGIDGGIASSAWYQENRGYKIDIVCYTISFLRYKLLELKKDINLDIIYKSQSISPSLSDESLKIGKFIQEKITNDDFREGILNVSEFCKKDFAWKKIRKLSWDFEFIKESDLINDAGVKDKKNSDKEINKTGKEIDVMNALFNTKNEEWSCLIDFYKTLGYTGDSQAIRIFRKCSQWETKLPTEKDVKKAFSLREEAEQQGFEFL